jgi:hypothetical protein
MLLINIVTYKHCYVHQKLKLKFHRPLKRERGRKDSGQVIMSATAALGPIKSNEADTNLA